MDALTTANQQQSIALNTITKTIGYVFGQYTSKTYSGNTTDGNVVPLTATSGRLVNVSVVASGAGEVKFYNSASPTALTQDVWLYTLPANTPVGITQVGVQFTGGLIMVVGSGVTINATYSLG